MPEKSTEDMIKELYITFNPTSGVKPPIERIFDEMKDIKDAAKALPCQIPDAPCPKGATGLSLNKRTGTAIFGGITAAGYGIYEFIRMMLSNVK